MTQTNQITEIDGNRVLTPQYVRQSTLQYKTFIKRAVVEALQDAFKAHPDPEIRNTRIDIEYASDRADFPAIVVKFYERDLNNAGVGHVEWGPSPADPNYPDGPCSIFVKYYHRIYKGDLEFEVYGLSSVDRDKVVDGLVEVIAMAEVTQGGSSFIQRIYDSLEKTPFGNFHFITLNTDLITGYGEQQMIAPWMPEDTLTYQASYRIPVLGEFYSLTPDLESGLGLVEEVDFYPWDTADPEDFAPEDFPEGIIPPNDYIKVRKHHKVIPEHGLETSLTLETSLLLETKA